LIRVVWIYPWPLSKFHKSFDQLAGFFEKPGARFDFKVTIVAQAICRR